jgi:protein phosphatase
MRSFIQSAQYVSSIEDSRLKTLSCQLDEHNVYAISEGFPDAQPSMIFLEEVEKQATVLRDVVLKAKAKDASRKQLRQVFGNIFEKSTERIRKAFQVDLGQVGPTTSGTVIALAEGYAALGHVGNNRACVLRNGRLFRLTKEHNSAQLMVEMGQISQEEIVRHPKRHVLTRMIGQSVPLSVDVSLFRAHPGDRFLLLNHEIFEAVTQDEIRDMQSLTEDGGSFSEALVDLAGRREKHKDLGCLVIDVGRFPEPQSRAALVTMPDPDTEVVERIGETQSDNTGPGEGAEPGRLISSTHLDNLSTAIDHFRHMSLFIGMREDQITSLVTKMTSTRLDKGQALFEQGEHSDRLYVLVMGRVEVVQDGRNVTTIGPGNVIGELALLDGYHRSATIRAITGCHLMSLSNEELQALVVSDPMFAVRLYNNLAQILAKRLRSTSSRRF